jgi:flagellar biosynthesis/type III secretory pathway chaperone
MVEEQLAQLEDTLVSEFRILQSLINVTQKESSALLKGSHSILMPILEDKETLLDQMNSLEDAREKISNALGDVFGLHAKPTTIRSLLPYVEKEQAGRFQRLCDGIIALGAQQKELNLNVNTLAQNWIDMIHSTQAYLLSFYQAPATYQPPGSKGNHHVMPVWATEHRA